MISSKRQISRQASNSEIVSSESHSAEQATDRELAALSIRRLWRRAATFLVVILLATPAVLAMGWQKPVSLELIIAYRHSIETFVQGHYATALIGYIGAYAAAAGLAFPGVIFMTMAGGVFFGGILGGIAAVIGATLGATCVFLFAKLALRNLLSRHME
ncbi:MAG TPA: hypothetical protein VE224_14230, partial [Pseudolabrys sp.]|nr:hypothetical protein [Pseudolabrys sp.]